MSARVPAKSTDPVGSSTRSSGSGMVGPLGVKGSFTSVTKKKSSFISTAAPPVTSGKAATQKIDVDAVVVPEEYNEDEENEDGEPKADRTYKYACGGRNVRPGNLKGKKVEWTATIECPLEELIYPSLQHFDDVGTDVYDATGITKEMNMVMKPASSSGQFTGLTPKWVASIDDTQVQDMLSPQAEVLKDRYSVTDINTRGEMHLRRRLKESAGVDLLAHANGWPLLHGNLSLPLPLYIHRVY